KIFKKNLKNTEKRLTNLQFIAENRCTFSGGYAIISLSAYNIRRAHTHTSAQAGDIVTKQNIKEKTMTRRNKRQWRKK
ncbi:MAG: hypothetical protein ACLTAN_07730, partial [Christensenellaceae bacterium]